MDNNQRLVGLQSLRGVAALMVLVHHAIIYSCIAKGVDFMPYLKISFGGLGVQLFFVISGFVMANCLHQGKRFLGNRILRIYPGFWLSVAVSAALLSDPYFGWSFDWKSLALMPTKLHDSYRIPYWTLIYEMGFYIVTYVLILLGMSKEAIVRFCLVWLLAIIVVAKYIAVPAAEPGAWLLLGPNNIFFISGLLFGLNYSRIDKIGSLGIAGAALLLWCLGESLPAIPATFALAASFCALLLIGIRHIRLPLLEKVGDASYGLYLMHVPVATLVIHVVMQKFPTIGLWSLWSVVMVTAFAGSMLFGIFEYKMHARIKRFMRARKGALAPAAAS